MVDKFFIWIFHVLGDLYNRLQGFTPTEILLLVLLFVAVRIVSIFSDEISDIKRELDCISGEMSSMSDDLNEIKRHVNPNYVDDSFGP
jgi:hypothetical protein